MADLSTLHYIPGKTENKTSREPVYVIIIIILVLIAIGLAIWLVFRYVFDRDKKDRTAELNNPKITADNTSITGSWTTVGKPTDKVTLYVSEKPLNPGADGTIPCNTTTVKCSNKTGSNNSITISASISPNTTYHCWLIVTGDDTASFKPFSKIVFTQETSAIRAAQTASAPNGPNLFEIIDLNSPNGSVSDKPGYTTKGHDIGLYRLGSAIPTANSASESFIINYMNMDIPTSDTDIKGETNKILCRMPTTTNIIFGEWCNHNDGTDAPDIGETPDIRIQGKCALDSADVTAADRIDSTNCIWNYGDSPPSGAEGTNQWCLQAAQQTNATSPTLKENLCMAKNGKSLDLLNISTITNTWFNRFVKGTV